MPKTPVTDPIEIGRDQILTRLWFLANLSPETTRGSMAGQIKALSMIIAIEGLIPNRGDHRSQSPVPAPPAPVKASIYISEPTRRRQAEAAAARDAVTPTDAQPPASPMPEPPLPPTHNPASPEPFPKGMNWVPEANGRIYDADVHPAGPHRLPVPPRKNPFTRGR